MPNFTFIGAEILEYSPQTVKIRNFGHKFAPQGQSFAPFLRNSQRLYAAVVDFKFLIWPLLDKQPRYKHFPAVRAFSHKFSIFPSGVTADRIKKN